jgi:thiol-disulfide isomerase/thioredoxin
MKSKKILLILAGVFVILMVGAGILYSILAGSVQPETAATTPPPIEQTTPQKPEEDSQTEPQQETIPAPDFTVYDAEGNPVRLSDYTGKPIVLNFWASWCGPCRMEMPHFEQAYQNMSEDIQFLMVNMTTGRETQKSAQDFLDETGYTFPVLFDLDMDAAYTYGVYSLPMTVFIDEDGNVQDLAIGAIDEATLHSKIDKIL